MGKVANFLLLYHGGFGFPQTDEDKKREREAWTKWLAGMDGDLVDEGNPTSNVKTVSANGAAEFSGNRVSGYGIIQADSLVHAIEKVKSVPIVTEGGSVDVYETFPAM